MRFVVHPFECDLLFERPDPPVAGCWQVEAFAAAPADGSDPTTAGETAYQSLDGILFELQDHRVIGTFPVE